MSMHKFEKEMEKKLKLTQKEILQREFLTGFICDYGMYYLNHPFKALAPAVGVGVVGGVAVKVITGTIPLPAKILLNVGGSMLMPTIFGMRRVNQMKKNFRRVQRA